MRLLWVVVVLVSCAASVSTASDTKPAKPTGSHASEHAEAAPPEHAASERKPNAKPVRTHPTPDAPAESEAAGESSHGKAKASHGASESHAKHERGTPAGKKPAAAKTEARHDSSQGHENTAASPAAQHGKAKAADGASAHATHQAEERPTAAKRKTASKPDAHADDPAVHPSPKGMKHTTTPRGATAAHGDHGEKPGKALPPDAIAVKVVGPHGEPANGASGAHERAGHEPESAAHDGEKPSEARTTKNTSKAVRVAEKHAPGKGKIKSTRALPEPVHEEADFTVQATPPKTPESVKAIAERINARLAALEEARHARPPAPPAAHASKPVRRTPWIQLDWRSPLTWPAELDTTAVSAH